jgi:hypothetical protein
VVIAHSNFNYHKKKFETSQFQTTKVFFNTTGKIKSSPCTHLSPFSTETDAKQQLASFVCQILELDGHHCVKRCAIPASM